MQWLSGRFFGLLVIIATVALCTQEITFPLRIIDSVNDHIELTDAGRDILSHPYHFISVVGRNKRGKSFMINQLLGLSNKQERLNVSSDASSPGTTGVWASHPVCIDTSDFIQCANESHCRRCAVLLDVEGVYSPQGDETTDHALVLVSLAISDLTIFNTDQKLDMADLLEAADAMKLSEVYSDISTLPNLLFTVQKYTLDIGSLPSIVEDMPGSHKAMRLFRDTLGRFSGDGTPIMTLPPAVSDSKLWKRLDSGNILFDEEYLDALADVRSHVVTISKPWRRASSRLNLIERLVDLLLTNPTPTTERLATQVSRAVTVDVEADVITAVSGMIPLHKDVFEGQLRQLIDEAGISFQSRCKQCSFDSTALFERSVKMNFDAAAYACSTDAHRFRNDIDKVKRHKDLGKLQRTFDRRTVNCWADPTLVQGLTYALDRRGDDLDRNKSLLNMVVLLIVGVVAGVVVEVGINFCASLLKVRTILAGACLLVCLAIGLGFRWHGLTAVVGYIIAVLRYIPRIVCSIFHLLGYIRNSVSNMRSFASNFTQAAGDWLHSFDNMRSFASNFTQAAGDWLHSFGNMRSFASNFTQAAGDWLHSFDNMRSFASNFTQAAGDWLHSFGNMRSFASNFTQAAGDWLHSFDNMRSFASNFTQAAGDKLPSFGNMRSFASNFTQAAGDKLPSFGNMRSFASNFTQAAGDKLPSFDTMRSFASNFTQAAGDKLPSFDNMRNSVGLVETKISDLRYFFNESDAVQLASSYPAKLVNWRSMLQVGRRA
ncbi:hypothetical protein J8273_4890 [Carpediemonas membranifera]|uniref:Guanylate-binding protein N-terminal domain-containing protein n=1 Tax=Carpediemonas membranifera TaxID=201153 RepID=A0A8J6BXL0_9EUKA|nr:hypothetical protein J8273_4890 [Carpediemonas membranifera]|eukprot:KAG9393591.1 hypothetical protein J8273_4890 [Carpediemonas membranifera]